MNTPKANILCASGNSHKFHLNKKCILVDMRVWRHINTLTYERIHNFTCRIKERNWDVER